MAVLCVGTARAETAAVTIDTFTFGPASLEVARGSTVVFTNRDDIPHTVTGAATGATSPPTWRSPPLDTGDRYERVFDTPGAYAYFCSLHPMMQGVIIVR